MEAAIVDGRSYFYPPLRRVYSGRSPPLRQSSPVQGLGSGGTDLGVNILRVVDGLNNNQ